MRTLVVVVGLVAACSDEGAHLTFSAPAGPASATSFQLVLASPELVPMIGNQRVAPKGLSTETVTYYLQRTTAGAMPDQGAIDQVDQFTVLVEPNATIADTAFIPFVVLYDANQQVVGMGAFHGSLDAPDPSQIVVLRGQVDRYTIDVEPVTEVTDLDPVGAQQAMQVSCAHDDQTTFLSGIVWRPAAGGEIRLMMPDDPTSTDATQRTLDLDCDDHEVMVDDASADCDDTRARFHAGAAEVCNGEDANCDAIPYFVVPCTGSGLCNNSITSGGFSLCDNTTGTQSQTCSSDVSCACAGGTGSCNRCVMQYAQGSAPGVVAPCQPAISGFMTIDYCSNAGCTVEVLGTRGGWDVTVSPTTTSTGIYGPIATPVTGSFGIKASRPEGPGAQLAGTPGGSVGSVDLVIIDGAGAPHLMSVDLEIGTTHGTCTGNGPFTMACD